MNPDLNRRLEACPFCDSGRLDYEFTVHGHTLRRCADCGLKFFDPQPGDALLEAAAAPAGAGEMKMDQALRGLKIPQTAAGGGARIIRAARGDRFEVLGGQPENSGEADLSPGSFDACLMPDTLEKSRRPFELLKKAHGLLKPGGALLLSIPGLDSRPSPAKSRGWTRFQPDRIFFFDSQTLQNALAKAGFERVETAGNGGVVLARAAEIRPRQLLSVIVPVYNEAATFSSLMEKLMAKQVPEMDREIIVVESNSTDGTREAAKKLEGAPGIRLVLQDRPLGKGNAVREGLEAATGDILMIQDGDLEYDLDDYDQLLEPVRLFRKAFVLGSRHLGDWKIRNFATQWMTAHFMNLGHIFFAFLINLTCSARLKDPFTMFKVFRRDCLHGMHFKCDRFDFDIELIIKLMRKGYQPLEIPVNYNSRSFNEGKKVRMFRDPFTWLVAIFRARFGRL